MNLSAGGAMVLEAPRADNAVSRWRGAPSRRWGCGSPRSTCSRTSKAIPARSRIIEVNSNPSIRLLEDSDRGDLILKIWHHTFSAMGLL